MLWFILSFVIKMVSALSLAYFCNVWACWPTLFPKAGVINRDGGGVLVKTQQEGIFHYSELHRSLLMVCYENLVVMEGDSQHSSESPSSAWIRN